MKTWEMMKMATEKPERLFVNENGLEFGGGNNDRLHTMHLDYLQNGEWTEIRKPVSFMEAVASGKRILYQNPNDGTDGEKSYCALDEFLELIGQTYTEDEVADLILNGKFYTED